MPQALAINYTQHWWVIPSIIRSKFRPHSNAKPIFHIRHDDLGTVVIIHVHATFIYSSSDLQEITFSYRRKSRIYFLISNLVFECGRR